MRSILRALVGFNNRWINLIFKKIHWVSMSKIHNAHFQMGRWVRCLGGRIVFTQEEIVYSFFNCLSDIFCNSIYFTYGPKFWSKIYFRVIFSSQGESYILFQVWIFFVKLLHFLSQVLLSWTESPKNTSTILMENYD